MEDTYCTNQHCRCYITFGRFIHPFIPEQSISPQSDKGFFGLILLLAFTPSLSTPLLVSMHSSQLLSTTVGLAIVYQQQQRRQQTHTAATLQDVSYILLSHQNNSSPLKATMVPSFRFDIASDYRPSSPPQRRLQSTIISSYLILSPPISARLVESIVIHNVVVPTATTTSAFASKSYPQQHSSSTGSMRSVIVYQQQQRHWELHTNQHYRCYIPLGHINKVILLKQPVLYPLIPEQSISPQSNNRFILV